MLHSKFDALNATGMASLHVETEEQDLLLALDVPIEKTITRLRSISRHSHVVERVSCIRPLTREMPRQSMKVPPAQPFS